MGVNVHEIKIKSSGFPGAPGWTTLYFDGDDPTLFFNQYRHAKTFLGIIRGVFPSTWTAAVQPAGKLLVAASGVLVQETTLPPDGTGDPVVGTDGSPGYGSGASGMCISWRTAGVNRGHNVRGRSYLVPIGSGVYGIDGTIVDAFLPDLRNLLTAWALEPNNFGVWSRPRLGVGGAFFEATQATISDQAAVLTSRRH